MEIALYVDRGELFLCCLFLSIAVILTGIAMRLVTARIDRRIDALKSLFEFSEDRMSALESEVRGLGNSHAELKEFLEENGIQTAVGRGLQLGGTAVRIGIPEPSPEDLKRWEEEQRLLKEQAAAAPKNPPSLGMFLAGEVAITPENVLLWYGATSPDNMRKMLALAVESVSKASPDSADFVKWLLEDFPFDDQSTKLVTGCLVIAAAATTGASRHCTRSAVSILREMGREVVAAALEVLRGERPRA